MNELTTKVRYFLFGQNFSDGVRITFAILLPTVILSYFNQLANGLTLSLGALCVSIVDTPGPVIHKRNGMLLCDLFMFVTALITGYARLNVYTLGLEILALSFLFSMFNVFGARAASVGTAALLIMILMMERELKAEEIPAYSALILAGGIWYTIVSLVFSELMPYRPAQRALGDCIRETAKFLAIKANFYNTGTDLDADYKKLLNEQVYVSEKQNSVRELLFKSRQIMKESTLTGRMLVLIFVDLVDIYEHITAMYYDYSRIREQYKDTGILTAIYSITKEMATELDAIGIMIQSDNRYHKKILFDEQLAHLKTEIDKVSGDKLVLLKVLETLKSLCSRLSDIQKYSMRQALNDDSHIEDIEFTRFAPSQSYHPALFRNNFSFKSSIFRHSMRMALVSLLGFIVAKIFSYGHHGYWVLLTILVILKPGFSLTKERNYQRLMGTIVGALIGVIILYFVDDRSVLLGLMIFFMLGAYSFTRTNYIVMVILMTPYILILFDFLGVGKLNIVEERVFDTLIGSVIAFAASYLVFPSWESSQLHKNIEAVLKANMEYLQLLTRLLEAGTADVNEYKLVRKDVYVSSANLSAAFQRMISEPKSKQKHKEEIHQFVVLNHIMSSNIAPMTTQLMTAPVKAHQPENVTVAKDALNYLKSACRKINDLTDPKAPKTSASAPEALPAKKDTEEYLLQEQLEFIRKLAKDIDRVAGLIG
jgi:uncharacterized membrane protein (TIGR01666 family)